MNGSWCHHWEHGPEWEVGPVAFSSRTRVLLRHKTFTSSHLEIFLWPEWPYVPLWMCFPSLILSSVPAGMVQCMVTLPPRCRSASLLGQHPYTQDWPLLPLIPWQFLWYGHSVVDTTLQAQPEPFLRRDGYESEGCGTAHHHIKSFPFSFAIYNQFHFTMGTR